MKRSLIAAASLCLVTATGLASAASWDTIVAPGTYGRVPVGGYAQPPEVYSDSPILAIAQAVLSATGVLPGYGQAYPQQYPQAYPQQYPQYSQQYPQYSQYPQQAPVYQQQAPVYMWVPAVQRSNWSQYCGQYSACNVPVYFVQDRWYNDNVIAHRNWTAQQRAWNQSQWLEQDRIARARWEQARWDRERLQREHQATQRTNWDQARQERDRIERDHHDHGRRDQEHGRAAQPVATTAPGQRGQWDRDHDDGRRDDRHDDRR